MMMLLRYSLVSLCLQLTLITGVPMTWCADAGCKEAGENQCECLMCVPAEEAPSGTPAGNRPEADSCFCACQTGMNTVPTISGTIQLRKHAFAEALPPPLLRGSPEGILRPPRVEVLSATIHMYSSIIVENTQCFAHFSQYIFL